MQWWDYCFHCSDGSGLHHHPAKRLQRLFAGLQRKQLTGCSSRSIMFFTYGGTFPLLRFHCRMNASVINDSNPSMAASHLVQFVYCARTGCCEGNPIESIKSPQAMRQSSVYFLFFLMWAVLQRIQCRWRPRWEGIRLYTLQCMNGCSKYCIVTRVHQAYAVSILAAIHREVCSFTPTEQSEPPGITLNFISRLLWNSKKKKKITSIIFF